jgi:hypothetical protein
MGRTACAEPRCLYKGDLYLTLRTRNGREKHVAVSRLAFSKTNQTFVLTNKTNQTFVLTNKTNQTFVLTNKTNLKAKLCITDRQWKWSVWALL